MLLSTTSVSWLTRGDHGAAPDILCQISLSVGALMTDSPCSAPRACTGPPVYEGLEQHGAVFSSSHDLGLGVSCRQPALTLETHAPHVLPAATTPPTITQPPGTISCHSWTPMAWLTDATLRLPLPGTVRCAHGGNADGRPTVVERRYSLFMNPLDRCSQRAARAEPESARLAVRRANVDIVHFADVESLNPGVTSTFCSVPLLRHATCSHCEVVHAGGTDCSLCGHVCSQWSLRQCNWT